LVYRRKRGFGVPLSDWFRGDLAGFALDVFRGSALRDEGIFEPGAVEGMIEDHRRGRSDNGHQIYAILVFALWREHLSRRWKNS